MSGIIKFILTCLPFETLINALCDLIKSKITSKTKTKLDDVAVDNVLRPTLLEWAIYAKTPTDYTLNRCIKVSAFNIIDYINEPLAKEIKERLEEKFPTLR